MSEKALAILIIMLFLCPISNAPAQEQGGEEIQPSLELLEFLGEWTIEEDELLDPADLDKMKLPAEEHEDENKQD